MLQKSMNKFLSTPNAEFGVCVCGPFTEEEKIPCDQNQLKCVHKNTVNCSDCVCMREKSSEENML